MKKVHEWLSELFSHDIYNHKDMKEDFEKDTGQQCDFTTHSVKQTKAAIEARGLGGNVNGADDEIVCYGWEVAEDLAEHFCKFRSTKMGRGFIFRECLAALKEKDV